MEETFENTIKQAAAFQKMWMDSMTGMTRVWSEYSPQNPPPDELKKVRQGVLKVISRTWEDYMRSPEFLDAMRDTMNNSIRWQKWSKDNSRKFHQTMGSASKDDMQGVMVAIQHVERRVLDCLDEMQTQVNKMQAEMDGMQEGGDMKMERYQQEVLARLERLEKAMMNGAKKISDPAAPQPKTTKKVVAAKKTATKRHDKKGATVEKTTAKKAVEKKAKPKKRKGEES